MIVINQKKKKKYFRNLALLSDENIVRPSKSTKIKIGIIDIIVNPSDKK